MEGQGFVKISEIEATKRLNDSLEQVAAPSSVACRRKRERESSCPEEIQSLTKYPDNSTVMSTRTVEP